MFRNVSIALVIALLGISVARGEEATKEETMKAWEYFVGTWKTVGPGGVTSGYSCEKTKFGSLLFHNEELSLLVGWDSSANIIKSVGLNLEGEVRDTWKLVGDGPRFEGSTKDGTKLSIQCTGKDRYVLMIGDMKTVGERIR